MTVVTGPPYKHPRRNSGINRNHQNNNTSVRQELRSQKCSDPSYQSYGCSQDVVWSVRRDDDFTYATSLRRRRDKALDIFRHHSTRISEITTEDTEITSNADENDASYSQCPNGFPKQTREGIIDDRKVVFELVSNVNQKPKKCLEERMKVTYNSCNHREMSREEKIRLYMCQWNIVQLFTRYIIGFMVSNIIFACLFHVTEDGCCGDPNLRFEENLQFAIQTWTTIGYGTLSPVGHYASALVTIISIIGLIANTVFAGLLFNRIMRPAANLQFSTIATYCNVHGLPCLEIRVGNPDAFNPLIDIVGTLHIMWEGTECDPYAIDNKLADKKESRSSISHMSGKDANTIVITKNLRLLQDSFYTLPGVRNFRHVIDESSPLFGLRLDEFNNLFYLQFRMQATNQTTQSQISLSTSYGNQDILVGHRFQSQVRMDRETMAFVVDFSKMNETTPHPVWYPKKTEPNACNENGNGGAPYNRANPIETHSEELSSFASPGVDGHSSRRLSEIMVNGKFDGHNSRRLSEIMVSGEFFNSFRNQY